MNDSDYPQNLLKMIDERWLMKNDWWFDDNIYCACKILTMKDER